ncbi:hypothetical protein ABGB17_05075 [Sphaerisporangium sp. B11E5]|uniref:hypothetical protein n=1 Tax=Sphaerisporangium sp. B11E5 TaxID=3153563 RepID=UPI00325C7786
MSGELAAGLGPAAASVLSQWAEMEGYTFKLIRWLLNGRSTAQVAVVREAHSAGYRNLILKVDHVPADRAGLSERRRQVEAFQQAPEGFPEAHLARTAHQSLPVGEGRWIVFQEVAGPAMERTIMLSTLLEAVRSGQDSPELFTSACETIVHSVLDAWAVHPAAFAEDMTASEFLRHVLVDKLRPGTKLQTLAAAPAEPDVVLDGVLSPNPFALLSGRLDDPAGPFTPFLGRAHGDLHVENVLLPVAATVDPAGYRLIDLAKYSSDAPLTRDPVHFVLNVVVRVLPDLSPSQRQVLMDVLIGRPDPAERLPSWLAAFVTRIRMAAEKWLAKSSLATEWRQQSMLSLIACALIFMSRKSTPPEDRPWFHSLAARATAAYLDQVYRGHAYR